MIITRPPHNPHQTKSPFDVAEIGKIVDAQMNVQEAERKRQDEERMRECRINAIDEMMKAWDLTLYDLKAYESHDCGCGCCR